MATAVTTGGGSSSKSGITTPTTTTKKKKTTTNDRAKTPTTTTKPTTPTTPSVPKADAVSGAGYKPGTGLDVTNPPKADAVSGAGYKPGSGLDTINKTPAPTPTTQSTAPVVTTPKATPTPTAAPAPAPVKPATITKPPVTQPAPAQPVQPQAMPLPNAPTQPTQPAQPTNNPEASFVDTTEGVFSGLNSLMDDMRRMGTEGMAAMAVQYTEMLKMIDAMQQQVVGQLQQQMGGVDKDPQILAAIGVIRDEVVNQRNMMLEELNSKGLAQSGILLEMSDRLNKGQLTQVQQLVASRFGELQNQLNQAVMNFANMRVSALQGYQGNVNNMYNTNMSNMMNVGLATANAGMQAAGLQNQYSIAQMQNNTDLWKTQYNGAMNYNINSMNNANAYNMNTMDNNTQRYGYDVGYASDIYKTDANNKNNLDVARLSAASAANVARINGQYDLQTAQMSNGTSGNPADMANQAVSEILRDYPSGKLGYNNVNEIMTAIDNNPNIPDAYKNDMKKQLIRAVESKQIPWSIR